MKLTSIFRKGPPPTLQILFQGEQIAELTKLSSGGKVRYSFRYLPAFERLNLAALPGLPVSPSALESSELWPFFAERIPDARRPEIQAWMKLKGLTEQDDIRLLAELGSHSVTDPFEILIAA